eukprot:312873-Hanusia_phi.AAC.4
MRLAIHLITDVQLKPLLDANAEQGKTLQMQSETVTAVKRGRQLPDVLVAPQIQKLERDILDEKEKQTESPGEHELAGAMPYGGNGDHPLTAARKGFAYSNRNGGKERRD